MLVKHGTLYLFAELYISHIIKSGPLPLAAFLLAILLNMGLWQPPLPCDGPTLERRALLLDAFSFFFYFFSAHTVLLGAYLLNVSSFSCIWFLKNLCTISSFSYLEPIHFPQDLNWYCVNDLIPSISYYNAIPEAKPRHKAKYPNIQSLNL